ncbi:MAG: TorF family putative porin [Gammaproteobacteria bacterium]|nr:TorF family putative porin [Gammaproteobacteria bacterium]MCY4342915.1 TorF family putative porin [Gammaproteobacteria bacterium]
MKRLLVSLLAVATGAASLAFAASTAWAAEFSGNVTYATDYRFRGISQGDRSQAIQGGFDLELENGFYVGTWASNVAAWSGGTIETDYYGGFGGEFSEGVAYDIGVLYYGYPEDDASPDLDYVEIYGSVSIEDFTIGAAFSPDYFAGTGDFWYLYGDYSYGLVENVSLDLHLGWNIFDGKSGGEAFGIGNAGDPDSSYIDYSVGLGTSGLGLDWGIALVGTNLSESECFGGSATCDTTVVVSVSKSL